MGVIYSNPLRLGNFTSSEAHRLMKSGKAKGSWSTDVFSYIEETNMERRLGRPVDLETDARPLGWGRCCEPIAFDLLPTEYTLCSDQTLPHPDIDFLVGSPDATTVDACADLKCPMTPKSFCQMVDPYYEDGKLIHDALTIEAVRANHKDGDKFFYQILSNAIITKKKTGRLIVFMPYEEEIETIRQSIEGNPDYYWLWMADKAKLPYLIKGLHYQNVNVIEFPIMDRDVHAFETRVKEAGEFLIPRPPIIQLLD